MTVGRAQAALDAVHADPRRAVDLATELLGDGDGELAAAERAGALWAVGRARSELDEVDEAIRTLGEAVEIAEAAGLLSLAAEIRVSRSVCRLTAGDVDGARADLDVAEQNVDAGGALGRLVMQRGLLSIYAGRLADALVDLDRALPLLLAAGDAVARCRLLSNRGVVNAFSGNLVRAESDLVECRDLALELGQDMTVAAATHNLGYVRGRAGDVPAALDWFEQARGAYAATGATRLLANLEIDLCGVLLTGGLYAEAIEAARRAEEAAAGAGNRLTEAEAQLLRAHALLAHGDVVAAEELALIAAEAFRLADRGPWAAQADHLALRAASADRAADPTLLLARALDLIGPLTDDGWYLEAVEVRTLAGRLALQLGQLDRARSLLARSAAERRSGTAAVRANAWLATAALRRADGNRAGAKRALVAGMAVVESHRATLGATELRAHASAQAAELAASGLQLAVDGGRGVELFRWAERWHAGALSLPPVRPPEDSRLAHLLAELRAAHADARDAALSGREDPRAAATIARLEAQVRAASRIVAGDARDGAPSSGRRPLDPRAVRAQLEDADAVLVEYVVVQGSLHAVVVAPRGCRAVDLGPFGAIATDVAVVLAAVRRLAHGRASARSLAAAVDGIAAIGAAMDDRIIGPLRLHDVGEVVVVPTGELQMLPWSVLPSLNGRAVTVAPSAGMWSRTVPSAARRGVALIGGPDLEHVDREIDAIASLYAEPRVLRHPRASVADVLAAMSGAETVHLATHGTFRSDSPSFSALQVSDGPLTVYDLEQLSRPPRTVVAPACDAAMAAVQRGDELIGTSAALLAMGVGTVVAPVTVVADAAVVELVTDLHRGLAAGGSPAASLAEAQAAAIRRGAPADVAAAHSMVVIGSHRA